MALVTEDGTGLSNAESYVSLADATTRHAALGNADWAAAASDTVREQALRRATAYMEGVYRSRWKGTKLLRDQALSWPRYGAIVDRWAVESTIVPVEVANACADLALKALSEELSPDLERGVVREKVGPLEVEYDRNSPQSKRFRAADMGLAPYLKGSTAMVGLVRA